MASTFPDIRTAARLLGGKVAGPNKLVCPGPGHSPKDRSLSVTFGPQYPDGFLVNSFAEDDPLACKDHVREKLNLPGFEPQKRATPEGLARRINDRAARANGANGQHQEKPQGRVVARYTYQDEHGNPYSQTVRKDDPKGFYQLYRNGTEWEGHKNGRSVIPYRLPEVRAADEVFVVEGEKDADTLAELGLVATTNPEGAGKWKPELNRWFAGKVVYIIPDNDDVGREHARQVATSLHGVAREVRIVEPPDLPDKGDVSDWVQVEGNDRTRLLALVAGAPAWEAKAEAERPVEGEALPSVGFEDLDDDVEKTWLLKNALALGETSSWVGGPGKGKSALLTDIAFHVASGRDWRGYRAKGRFGVVYIALERGDLLKRRLIAYRRKYGLPVLPIVVVTSGLDVMAPGCIPTLVATVKTAAKRYGVDAGLVICDTYAKAIAVGGGDEDKAKDQNRVLGHLRLVQAATGVHIALVGHTGKDETRGARGSNAHLGDVDVMVQFSGEAVKSAKVTKANDQPDGPLTSFTLETFVLGEDEDGDPKTTSIVAGETPEGEASAGNGRGNGNGVKLTNSERIALDMLRYAISEQAGEKPPPSNHIPASIPAVVQKERWRPYCYQGGISADDASDSARQKAFRRAVEGLQAKGRIRVWEPYVWPTSDADS